jgi:hypothetical protein
MDILGALFAILISSIYFGGLEPEDLDVGDEKDKAK